MTESELVTGGNGFIGRAIVNAVKAKRPSWTITVVDLHPVGAECSYVSYVFGDITNGTATDLTVAQIKPTAIIHTAGTVPLLASRYGKKDRNRVFDVNVEGTRNVLTAAKRHGVDAFVWTGSFTAATDDLRFQYPNINETWPTSSHSLVYGESKACFLSALDVKSTERVYRQQRRRLSLLPMTKALPPALLDLRLYLAREIINSSPPFTRVFPKARPLLPLVMG